jgi:adenylylsulfate kinase
MKTQAVVWITGLPSSGKSAFAQRLQSRLNNIGSPCVVLDGDDVRDALVPRPGYSPEERDAFYETLARLAAMLSRQGLIVIVAATSHRAIYRDRARHLAPQFIEVHIQTPLQECIRRDSKGLYARAGSGTAPELPGIAENYEAPRNPDIAASGGFDDAAIEAVLAVLA